jgi:hypothetical protein
MCLPNGLNLLINLQTYTIGAYTKLPYSIHDMVTPQFQPEILHGLNLVQFGLSHIHIYTYMLFRAFLPVEVHIYSSFIVIASPLG